MDIHKKVLSCLVVVWLTAISIAETQQKLTVGPFWLGQRLQEVDVIGDFLPESKILDKAKVIVARTGSGHFVEGTCVLTGGSILSIDGVPLVEKGQSRDAVLQRLQEKGWRPVSEWKRASDVADFNYLMTRFRVSDEIYILISFLETSDRDSYTVSEVYLRTGSARGPYGDSEISDS